MSLLSLENNKLKQFSYKLLFIEFNALYNHCGQILSIFILGNDAIF
jgi:hypothetical protein